MSVENSMQIIFKEIDLFIADLAEIIAPSIGNPTKEKVQNILENYQAEDHYLMGAIINDKLVGIIGIKLNKNTATIKHISVLEEFRKQGIARKLVQHLMDHFSLTIIKADTDKDAVEFYRSLGFKCEEFSTEYGIRYKCYLENIAI